MSEQFLLTAEDVVVVEDVVKGRCLEARREFDVGNIIFKEVAIAFASYEEDLVEVDGNQEAFTEADLRKGPTYDSKLKKCNSLHLQSTVDILETPIGNPLILQMAQDYNLCSRKEYETMAAHLETLPGVESLDTARNFLQLLILMFVVKSEGHGTCNSSSLSINIPLSLKQRIPFLKALKPSQGIEKCEAAAAKFRDRFSTFKPINAASNAQVKTNHFLFFTI